MWRALWKNSWSFKDTHLPFTMANDNMLHQLEQLRSSKVCIRLKLYYCSGCMRESFLEYFARGKKQTQRHKRCTSVIRHLKNCWLQVKGSCSCILCACIEYLQCISPQHYILCRCLYPLHTLIAYTCQCRQPTCDRPTNYPAMRSFCELGLHLIKLSDTCLVNYFRKFPWRDTTSLSRGTKMFNHRM